ncbi:MAG: TonB-dependent receptor [Saprospiraceae bacterium]|nr:TonB-dependent receptor [Saprospiraceae bacterium]
MKNETRRLYKLTSWARGCLQHAFLAGMILLLFSLTSVAGYSENATTGLNFVNITGKITDEETGEGLIGASVLIKGTAIGTVTDIDGSFSLDVPDPNAILVISYLGYQVIEVPLAGQTSLNVSLKVNTNTLDEIVVTGYGTQKKSDLTGAVAQIKTTQLENENPRTVQDLLRGNATGLDVSFNGSTKGGGNFLVRGKGSLTAQSAPLLVVDGVIYQGELSDINPNDIATVDILKDASSAAVFGSRSANGVILITTKRGKSSKPIITFNSNISTNVIAGAPRLLTPEEFINWRSDVLWSMSGHDSTSMPGIKYRFSDPRTLPSNVSLAQWMAFSSASGDPVDVWLNRLRLFPVEIANYKAGTPIDWEKELYNNNSLQHDHTVSVAGNTDRINYYMSFGYLKNDGLTVGDFFKTFRTRLNIDGKIASYLTVGLNAQFSDRDESSVPVTLNNMIQTTPYGQLYNEDGVTLRRSTNDDPGNNTNPYLDQFYTDRLRKFNNLFGSIFAKGDLPLGFSYQVNFTPRFEFSKNYQHISANKPDVATRKGISFREDRNTYQWQIDNILKWNKSIGLHNFDVTLLANAEKYQTYFSRIDAENYSPNDNLSYNAVNAAALVKVSSTDEYETGDALMGRLNYSYNSRYLLTVTGRRDGFSAFGQENPRAFFPSAALGWVFSEEKFMKKYSSFLDFGKLRLSYGENGNRSIGRYAALSNLASGSYTYITPSGQTVSVGRVTTNNISNPNLKWERNSSINVGLDYGILNSRITGSIDYYDRSTKDLLVLRALPNVTGFANVITNLGQVDNKGFEFSINSVNTVSKKFEWRTHLGFWTNQNKIVKLYGPVPVKGPDGSITDYVEQDDIANNWFIGKEIGVVYDYKVTGVWQQADAAEAKSYGFTPGDFRLEDLNGDGKYTIADRQFIGSRNPDFSFNLRNEFKLYKNFDFSFSLYGRLGQLSQFNEAKNVDRFYDRSQFYKRPYWTPDNPINDYAKMMSAAGSGVAFNVWRKSSFVRLNNISLAYSVPKNLIKRLNIDDLRAYFNIQNAAVFSSWDFFDPENVNPNDNGDNSKSISPRTYSFGINLVL